MREIKFRAWDGKRMLKGLSLIKLLNIFEWGETATTDSGNVDGTGWDTLQRAEDLKWLEFTGLRDKNGKEIYEGDIVRLVSKEDGLVLADVKASVIFDTTMFCARVYIDNDDLWDYDILEYQAKYIEVIGNIYENKELLNE